MCRAILRGFVILLAAIVCVMPTHCKAFVFCPKTTGATWDTWVYYHDGTFYLYYLAGPRGAWNSFALATSSDGLHWKEHGVLLTMAKDSHWMGTGSTWKSPNFKKDGKWYTCFAEWRGPGPEKGQQTIFFAESTNLMHWKRLGNEYEFKHDPRWYRVNEDTRSRWDCIWTIERPEGGLYGYWTANPKGRAGFGFGESMDGVSWGALPPPEIDWGKVPAPVPTSGEVGAVEKIGDTYYMLIGEDMGTIGLGMYTLVADKPQGPFRVPVKNFGLLANPQRRLDAYFTRFTRTPSTMLVGHFSIARDGRTYQAPLKAAVVDPEGTLRLGWWKGNEVLKSKSIQARQAAPHDPSAPFRMLNDPFDPETGFVLEGSVSLPAGTKKNPPGLWIESEGGQGTALVVDRGGSVLIGPLKADGRDFQAEQRIDREMPVGEQARIRLLVREGLAEFYLNDVLMQCYSLPGLASGRIGLLGGENAPQGLQAWSLPDDLGPGSATMKTPHAAVGKPVRFAEAPSPDWPGRGAATLTDGILPSLNSDDFKGKRYWCGFDGRDMEATVDLGQKTAIHRLSSAYLRYWAWAIHLPSEVEYAVSENGRDFAVVAVVANQASGHAQEPLCWQFQAEVKDVQARCVRVRAKNIKKVPTGAPAAGNVAWLFAGEILVNPPEAPKNSQAAAQPGLRKFRFGSWVSIESRPPWKASGNHSCAVRKFTQQYLWLTQQYL